MYRATLCHDGWISIYGFLSTAVPPILFSIYDILGSDYVPYKFWPQFIWLAVYYGIVNVLLRIKLQKDNFEVRRVFDFGNYLTFLFSFRLHGEPLF